MTKSIEAIRHEWGRCAGVMVNVADLEEAAETLRILAGNFSNLAENYPDAPDSETWEEMKKDFEELTVLGYAAKRKILEYKKSMASPAAEPPSATAAT